MSATNSTLSAAITYTQRGLSVVPIPHAQKGPKFPRWQDLRLTELDLPQHFNGQPQNIGLLLGEPSGDLIDVDVDCPGALTLTHLLPDTAMVSGRLGKPGSHHFYKASGVRTERYKDLDGTTLIELRSTGAQTIVPPSTHPSGQLVHWERSDDPAHVDGEELERMVRFIAAAALLARHWPEGSRHEAALALAGGLLRSGWAISQVQEFLGAVADAADDEEAPDRVRAVGDTAEAQAAGKPTTGWPRLIELLDGDGKRIVGSVGRWLGLSTDDRNSDHLTDSEENSTEGRGKRSQATMLVELAGDAELFHTPEGDAYATLSVESHEETWRLRSNGFRRWLARRFYEEKGGAPGSQAIQDALGVLEGKALYEGHECRVHVRLAEHDGTIYLDLCDEAWRVVEVTPGGWRVVTDYPVKFRRTKGMLALPVPTPEGDLRELRGFLNLAGEEDWILSVAWLLAALRPQGPYPLLPLNGEQGSAKSTTARVLRALVDPSAIPLRTAPREERDLAIAASNTWVLAFDNLSTLPGWLSDALCRLATGGGFGTRTLYTDDEESFFVAQRPVILTGIGELIARGNLLDRAIPRTLSSITSAGRRDEATFWDDFARARPGILGALLDIVAGALCNLPHTRLDELPRMADFALWIAAAEPALGWERGTFMRAYAGSRRDVTAQALEASPVAQALTAFMDRRYNDHGEQEWSGTATILLGVLAAHVDETVQRGRGWPKAANTLTGELRRVAPTMRALGIDLELDRREGRGGTRTLRITRTTVQDERQQRQQRQDTAALPGVTPQREGFPADGQGQPGSSVTTRDRQRPGAAHPALRQGESGAAATTDDADDPPAPHSHGIPAAESDDMDAAEEVGEWRA